MPDSPTTFETSDLTRWTVHVTVGAIRRVRLATGIDLLDLESALATLGNDPVVLCDVLFALLQPQCEARGIEDIQFGELLAGEHLERATEALLEALINFFPIAKRNILRLLLRRTTSIAQNRESASLQKMEQLIQSNALERMLEGGKGQEARDQGRTQANIETPSGEPSTSWPASVESIPPHLRSAS